MSGPATASWPLTAPQKGMWSGQQLDPSSSAFWTAEAIELDGELDRAALERAIVETLNACDALHMRYAADADGEVRQAPAARAVALPWVDLSDPDERGGEASIDHAWQRARDWMAVDLRAPAELGAGPLFATALIGLGPQRHLWFLRAHHIALDGFAYLLLIHRVAQCYSALRHGRPLPPARDWSLRSVIDEDRSYAQSPACERDRAFWREWLAQAPPPVSLAAPRPPADRARSQQCRLPLASYRQWQVAARECGVDWSAWLLAAIAAWLHARSGAREVCLGLLVMNRLGSAALTVPCMAMNVVPLQVRVEPTMAFAELARAVAAAQQRLRPHRRYNYERLRADAGLGDSERQLYGPVVNLMPFDRGFVFEGLHSRAHPVSVGAVDDLDITVSPLPDGLRLDIEANPHAYPAAALHAHAGALLAVIGAAQLQPRASVTQLVESAGAVSPTVAAARDPAGDDALAPALPVGATA
ncbi:MAG: condensation domain-containing protein [Lysobacter sp.]